ncbi:MAG: hypothetical protein OEZ13_04160 [Spirochaetia bacterium]|nr:hypothetical protein [Spirochaetia bacterium]
MQEQIQKRIVTDLKRGNRQSVDEHLKSELCKGFSSFAKTLADLWHIDHSLISKYAAQPETEKLFTENIRKNEMRVQLTLKRYAEEMRH